MNEDKYQDKALKLSARFFEDMIDAGEECGFDKKSVCISILLSLPMMVGAIMKEEEPDISGALQ